MPVVPNGPNILCHLAVEMDLKGVDADTVSLSVVSPRLLVAASDQLIICKRL